MSRFSLKDQKTDKLADNLLQEEKKQLVSMQDDLTKEQIETLPAELFERAEYSEQAA